jgi:hypothetical protein
MSCIFASRRLTVSIEVKLVKGIVIEPAMKKTSSLVKFGRSYRRHMRFNLHRFLYEAYERMLDERIITLYRRKVGQCYKLLVKGMYYLTIEIQKTGPI